MLSMTSCAEQVTLPLFATAESVVKCRKTTLKDKSRQCKSNSKERKLSETLAVDSTTSEKDLSSYWNDYIAEKSSRLWLPTKTVLQDLALNSSNGWHSKTGARSWFLMTQVQALKQNSHKIFCPSSIRSLIACTDYEGTDRQSKKIRVYPASKQRQIIRVWLDAARWFYNQTVEVLTGEAAPYPNYIKVWHIIKGCDIPERFLSVPYQIKRNAVKEACVSCKAVINHNKQLKEGEIPAKLHFRSRKHPIQSCYIPKSAISEKGVYRTILGVLKRPESLPEECFDSRLVKIRDHYYLCVPQKVHRNAAETQGRVVALDPGIRSFQTFFSPTSCGKMGENDFGHIVRMCHHLDNLISRTKRETLSWRKKRMRHAQRRMRTRIRNLVDELHHQCARWLVDNFDLILLPPFNVSDMVKRSKRKIRSKSVRSMLTWAHHRFKTFLQWKAWQNNKRVLIVNEAYTSKTVSWTGEVIENLGGRKTVVSKDGQQMDRDINGARGIFLRALRDHSMLQQACIV